MVEAVNRCTCNDKSSCPLIAAENGFKTMNIDYLILYAKGKVVPDNCKNRKHIIEMARRTIKVRLKI